MPILVAVSPRTASRLATIIPAMQSIPSTLHAGDTWSWRDSFFSYRASDGWTLAYSLKNATSTIDLPSDGITADGGDFVITIPAASTASYALGSYQQTARVSKAGAVVTVGTGVVTIQPAGLSHARKTLAAIEAVIEGRASIDQQSYTIGMRTLIRTPIPELIKLRDLYRQEVGREKAAEMIAQGLSPSGRVQVRF